MALIKTRAVVLKKLRLNEADNILTLLTSEGSKITAVAKGIRKTKSKFGGRLEPFSVVDLVLYEGKTLYTITQVNTVKDNKALHDYQNFITASAIADVIDKVTFEKGNDNFIYDNFIKALDLLAGKCNRSKLLLAFDWAVLRLLGFSPSVDAGCDCKGANYLDLSGEGLFCKNCRLADKQYAFVQSSTLQKLKSIMDEDLESVAKSGQHVSSDLRNITERYLNYQLELNLRSRSIIGRQEHLV